MSARPTNPLEAVRRFGWAETLGVLLLLLLTFVALAGSALAPHPIEIQVGAPFQAPTVEFPFGTDEIGRDVYSRVLTGVGLTFGPAVAIIGLGLLVGGFIGFVSGYLGGWVDRVLQRFTDLFLVLPATLIAIAVAAALGPGLRNLIIAIGIFWWPWYSRILRAEVSALRSQPHVEAARLAGASRSRIAFRYMLPGALPTVLVTATLDVANVILVITLLSFLGLGALAPAPELGAMTARSLSSLTTAWWIPVFPAVVVALMALGSNLAGDGLRNLVRSS